MTECILGTAVLMLWAIGSRPSAPTQQDLGDQCRQGVCANVCMGSNSSCQQANRKRSAARAPSPRWRRLWTASVGPGYSYLIKPPVMLVGGVAAHDVWKKARCKKAMKKSSMACLPHALSIMIDHDVKCLLFPFFRSPFFFHKRNSAQRDKEPFSFSFSKFSTCIWTLDLLLTELLKKKYEADALI